MQKLIRITNPSRYELDNINRDYLENGWRIKKMKTYNENVFIFLLEKETRKEKLEVLNDIANG